MMLNKRHRYIRKKNINNIKLSEIRSTLFFYFAIKNIAVIFRNKMKHIGIISLMLAKNLYKILFKKLVKPFRRLARTNIVKRDFCTYRLKKQKYMCIIYSDTWVSLTKMFLNKIYPILYPRYTNREPTHLTVYKMCCPSETV